MTPHLAIYRPEEMKKWGIITWIKNGPTMITEQQKESDGKLPAG